MVALDARCLEFAKPADHAIRFRAVSDDVSEVPPAVDGAGRSDDRVERHEVRMEVRNDGDSHGWPA
jgi:hypothetical protein